MIATHAGTLVPAAAARLHAAHPGIDLMLTEAEPPEALRMLRAGYVDVAVVFGHEQAAGGEGSRGILLLDEPVYLVTPALAAGERDGLAGYADERWIAGCERCRDHLLRQCAQAGFDPKIAFTTDDYVAVQALVAAGLGVATLPGLALRAARHPGIAARPLPGTRRRVSAQVYGAPPDPPATTLLLEVLAEAARSPQPGAQLSGGSTTT